MTLADTKSYKNISIIGPQGLGMFLGTTKSYAVRCIYSLCVMLCQAEYTTRPKVTLNVTEISAPSSEPCLKDDNLTIYAVPITPTAAPTLPPTAKRKREEDESDLDPGSAKYPRNKEHQTTPAKSSQASSSADRIQAKPWKNMQVNIGFMQNPNSSSASENTEWARKVPPCPEPLPIAVSYICVGPASRGKFDAQRATELGLQNFERRRVVNGETITLDDGTVVTPEMMLSPATPAAVSELPTVIRLCFSLMIRSSDLHRGGLSNRRSHRVPREFLPVCAPQSQQRASCTLHLLSSWRGCLA